jgi:hypothetical protein
MGIPYQRGRCRRHRTNNRSDSCHGLFRLLLYKYPAEPQNLRLDNYSQMRLSLSEACQGVFGGFDNR